MTNTSPIRRPDQVERMHLDFDGFFASVEQQVHPHLRGRPVGVVPFANSEHTCIIACSREAKLAGIKNVMSIREARAQCPDIVLVPQSPDLYRRAHNALVSEIEATLPVDAVKSIDELTCRLDRTDRADPQALGLKVKQRLREEIGPYITCSIGFAANRQLAKIACKTGKKATEGRYGDGLSIWHPKDMPAPLLPLPISDVPGIGRRLALRLHLAGISTMPDLLATQPKQMRKLWRNVTGERLWYALHGYDIQAPPSERAMYGHGRVLPPDHRDPQQAHAASRLLLTKAARRMRRDGWDAGRLWLWIGMKEDGWSGSQWLPAARDDQSILSALETLWAEAKEALPGYARIIRVHVTLLDLTRATARQLDMWADDRKKTGRWQAATDAITQLNTKYARTVISIGPWTPPPGGYAGGKISFTRIPETEDFW